jgi:hypothetical protein
MKSALVLSLSLCLLFATCKKEDSKVITPPPSSSQPLLKDIVYQGLPSPYYYFEYDVNNRINKASFASEAFMYQLQYQGNQLKEMKSIIASTKIKTIYQYDEGGRIAFIKINSEDGSTTFKQGFLSYNSQGRLTELEWELNITVGFALQRTLSFTYDNNGNVTERRDHRHFIEGKQQEALYIDKFEQYDDKVSVDDFSLLHEPSEHLVLFPGIRLQHNNPAKVIRTGDGLNYQITYNYTYNANKQPVQRVGSMLITNGPQSGQTFQLNAAYSYYP